MGPKKDKKTKRIIRPPKKIGGSRLSDLPKKGQELIHTFPRRSLTNFDISRIAREHRISGFRGVFMRDTLPKKPRENECAVMNLDHSSGRGTHWVCYKKTGNLVKYFDPTGLTTPPSEVIRYLNKSKITTNKKIYQSPGTHICGHLCLLFLLNYIN